jgi:hypothetical protein
MPLADVDEIEEDASKGVAMIFPWGGPENKYILGELTLP